MQAINIHCCTVQGGPLTLRTMAWAAFLYTYAPLTSSLNKLSPTHLHNLTPFASPSTSQPLLCSAQPTCEKEEGEKMENQELSTHHADASRPSLGFPLGTALLLIIIFCLSGFFSCCYHWDKLRSLRQSYSEDTDPDTDAPQSPSKSKPTYLNSKESLRESLPVLMPGDRIPKFIALPCPCEPQRPEKIAVVVQKPPQRPLPVPSYI